MLDVSLFRRPAFVGVQLATFCIGAGMFALFPFLSIYLQDILGNSPLGAGPAFPADHGLRLHRSARDAEAVRRACRCGCCSRRASRSSRSASLLMAKSRRARTGLRCLPGFVVSGIGIGLANPTIAARGAAESSTRPVREWRRGSATPRGSAGLAMGVAVFGAVLQHRVGSTSRRGRVSTARSSRPP